jgi:mannose/fructose/N-acetylgalactosamine-specific phosphotransferase system component IIC
MILGKEIFKTIFFFGFGYWAYMEANIPTAIMFSLFGSFVATCIWNIIAKQAKNENPF